MCIKVKNESDYNEESYTGQRRNNYLEIISKNEKKKNNNN